MNWRRMGTPGEIKRRFSRLGIIEVTVNRPREQLAAEILEIEAVERVESTAEGPFQKLTISIAFGADLRDTIVDAIGAENTESVVSRDPTLEEAYINILQR